VAKVIWTERALSQVREILDYIAEDSPTNAVRFGTRLVESPRPLAHSPEIGCVVPEFGDESIREIRCGPYRVMYKLFDDACYVTTVIHGSRDVARLVDPSDWKDN